MPLTAHGFPYLDGSEVAGTGIPDNSEDLANHLEDNVKHIQSGLDISGSVAATNFLDVVIVFPVPFLVAPEVVANFGPVTGFTTRPDLFSHYITGVTTTQFTCRIRNSHTAAVSGIPIRWIAHG